MKFDDLDFNEKKKIIDKARKRYEQVTCDSKTTRYDIVVTFTNGELVTFFDACFVLPATPDSRMVYIEESNGAHVIVMVDHIAMMRYQERREE